MSVHFHCHVFHKTTDNGTFTLAKGEGDTPVAALKAAMGSLDSPVVGGDWKEWGIDHPEALSDGWQKQVENGKLVIFPHFFDSKFPEIGALGLDDLVDDGDMSLEEAEGFIAEGLSILTAN